MNSPANLSRSSSEQNYHEQRKEYLANVSAADVVESPFVFCKRQLITSALTRIELFQKILTTQGCVVECGVHRANSLMLYYHLSTILEPYNFHRKIIGFDTFEGFRSLSHMDGSGLTETQFSDTNFGDISKWVDLQDINRALSHIPKVDLVKGDATTTIPQYVADNPHLIIALLYLDFDIYEPTMVALRHLLPLVPKGGIVGFDEINCKEWPGETIALKENLKIGSIRLQKFSYDPWVSYYVVE
jgi:hypothetical protein